MKTFISYRLFFVLVGLTLMLTLAATQVEASPTYQTETDFTAIDTYVAEQVDNLRIPGLALGIVQNGRVTHLQGFGVANAGGRAVTPQTPFYIASITKSFTALAVMQLVEAGQIDLDAPVQTYLPWFELADKEASAQITVRHLLTHTTGISTKDGDPDWRSQEGLEESVRGLGGLTLTQPVGTTFQYSNLNYGIAGLIVEKVSGQSYGDYVAEHIFQPLDMRHSYASRTPALANGLAQGYRYMFGRPVAFDGPMPPVNLPGGGLIISVEDMAHYAIAQLNEGRYGETTVLSPQGFADLHDPAVPLDAHDQFYGMGWIIRSLDGSPTIEHDGAIHTFRSQMIMLPEQDTAVILLANAHGFEQLMQLSDLSRRVVNMLNGEPAAPVSLIFRVRFLYWAILLMPLLQITGIVFSLRQRRPIGVRLAILVVLVYGVITLLWLFGVPQLMGPPFSAANRIFYPELAYGWITGVILGVGWSLIYAAMYLRASKL